jgi:hypothetical protein
MRTVFPKPSLALLALAFIICKGALGQNAQSQPPPQSTQTAQASTPRQSHQGSPGGQVGGSVGKGAAVAGKDVGVGTAKGTGKIVKGTGRSIGKLFHHHHHETPMATELSKPQN